MTAPEEKSRSASRAFAEHLRKTRERQNLTQSDVARLSGLTPAAISQLEGSLREPNFSTLVRLATALKTTPNDLMGIGAVESADPSIRALFRDVGMLEPEDFAKVSAFAQFLAHKTKGE